MQLTISIYKIN